MNESAITTENRSQAIRNLYGQDLSDSDCKEIIRSLCQYASVLLEIEEGLNDKTPNNNQAA